MDIKESLKGDIEEKKVYVTVICFCSITFITVMNLNSLIRRHKFLKELLLRQWCETAIFGVNLPSKS